MSNKIYISEETFKEYIDTDLEAISGHEDPNKHNQVFTDLPSADGSKPLTTDDFADNSHAPWWMSMYKTGTGVPYMENLNKLEENVIGDRTNGQNKKVDNNEILDLNTAIQRFKIPEIGNKTNNLIGSLNALKQTNVENSSDTYIIVLNELITQLKFDGVNPKYLSFIKNKINNLK